MEAAGQRGWREGEGEDGLVEGGLDADGEQVAVDVLVEDVAVAEDTHGRRTAASAGYAASVTAERPARPWRRRAARATSASPAQLARLVVVRGA